MRHKRITLYCVFMGDKEMLWARDESIYMTTLSDNGRIYNLDLANFAPSYIWKYLTNSNLDNVIHDGSETEIFHTLPMVMQGCRHQECCNRCFSVCLYRYFSTKKNKTSRNGNNFTAEHSIAYRVKSMLWFFRTITFLKE